MFRYLIKLQKRVIPENQNYITPPKVKVDLTRHSSPVTRYPLPIAQYHYLLTRVSLLVIKIVYYSLEYEKPGTYTKAYVYCRVLFCLIYSLVEL